MHWAAVSGEQVKQKFISCHMLPLTIYKQMYFVLYATEVFEPWVMSPRFICTNSVQVFHQNNNVSISHPLRTHHCSHSASLPVTVLNQEDVSIILAQSPLSRKFILQNNFSLQICAFHFFEISVHYLYVCVIRQRIDWTQKQICQIDNK